MPRLFSALSVQQLNCYYTPVVCCYLRQALAKYNWSGITAAIDCENDDIDAIYDDFIKVIKWHINCIVPTRNITMRKFDPSYIIHRIKLLLCKRNKLRRAGRVEHADNLAVKINRCIARNQSSALAGAKNSDTRQFWALLKKQGTGGLRNKMCKTLT